jgi:hypothetical protein
MSAHPLPRTAVAAASLLLAACGPAIRSARDEAIPIPQGATWAWGPREAGPREDGPREAGPRGALPPSDGARGPSGAALPGDEIVLQRFQRAVAAAMQTKGFLQVEAPADADFLLTVGFRAAGPRGPRGATTIGIGFGGMWGGRGRRGWYAPWGGGPWGYGPWGGGWMVVPWGWPWYGPMGWAQVPLSGAYGPMAYRESALVAMLRQRSTGYLAWRGQVATDGYAAGHLTQERMDALVAKLFRGVP